MIIHIIALHCRQCLLSMEHSNGVKTDLPSWRICSLKFTLYSTEGNGAKISYKFSFVCKKTARRHDPADDNHRTPSQWRTEGGLGCSKPHSKFRRL